MRLIIIATLALAVATGCGAVNRTGAVIQGDIIEHKKADGVRCYESQSGSLSCVVVRP